MPKKWKALVVGQQERCRADTLRNLHGSFFGGKKIGADSHAPTLQKAPTPWNNPQEVGDGKANQSDVLSKQIFHVSGRTELDEITLASQRGFPPALLFWLLHRPFSFVPFPPLRQAHYSQTFHCSASFRHWPGSLSGTPIPG